MALAGADLSIYPTSIGWDPRDAEDEQLRQKDAWITVQRGHSVTNHLPVLAANRIGHEEGDSGNSKGIAFGETAPLRAVRENTSPTPTACQNQCL